MKAAIADGNGKTNEKIEGLQKKFSELQTQADGIEKKIAERHVGGSPEGKGLQDFMKESDSLQRLLTDKKGSAILTIPCNLIERKTAIDSSAVGAATSGVLMHDRAPGIVAEARQGLTIRNALSSRPTERQLLDFVKVVTPLQRASPQIETHTKLENAATFTTEEERVRTLATWIPASKQILEDFTELSGFIRTGLAYYVDEAEENQLLFGTGAGQDLHGLVTQAADFDTGLLPLSGWTKIDVVGRAIQQITAAKEVAPTFIALNPGDWWDILLTKDSQERYLLPPNTRDLFGLLPIPTTSMTPGDFLVGSGSPVAAEIRDRLTMQVEISTQHEDYFARNMVAIRAEKRLALVVYRPNSFVGGTFSTSPA